VAIFQVEVPDKYVAQLSSLGRASFLTTMVIDGAPKVIEIDVLVLHAKEFLYTKTEIITGHPVVTDPPAVILPWVDPEKRHET
jgi:hypothetical protein